MDIWNRKNRRILRSTCSFVNCDSLLLNYELLDRNQGRIKEERACNLGNIRIQTWAGECA